MCSGKGRDQGSQRRDLESQGVGSGSAVFFMESGTRLAIKMRSGLKILTVFGIRGQHFAGQKYGISYEKNPPRYDPDNRKRNCFLKR